MILRVPRSLFSADPLIAEAKRRMRQRRVLVAVMAALLVVFAVAGAVELRSTSQPPATRHVETAFATYPQTYAGGDPVESLANGFTNLRFIPSAPFYVGIALHNDSSEPMTLVNVRAVLARDSVVRQGRTRLLEFGNCQPQTCRAPATGAIQPTGSDLTVTPGHAGGAQLQFRFLGCPRARGASVQPVRRIEVTYRDPTGATIRQYVGAGPLALRVVTPHPCG